jgi:hypothetical protein
MQFGNKRCLFLSRAPKDSVDRRTGRRSLERQSTPNCNKWCRFSWTKRRHGYSVKLTFICMNWLAYPGVWWSMGFRVAWWPIHKLPRVNKVHMVKNRVYSCHPCFDDKTRKRGKNYTHMYKAPENTADYQEYILCIYICKYTLSSIYACAPCMYICSTTYTYTVQYIVQTR